MLKKCAIKLWDYYLKKNEKNSKYITKVNKKITPTENEEKTRTSCLIYLKYTKIFFTLTYLFFYLTIFMYLTQKCNKLFFYFWYIYSTVVAANPLMRSTTNLLIINLAVADLLFVIFCVPFTATDYVLPSWPFGDTWCKFVCIILQSEFFK